MKRFVLTVLIATVCVIFTAQQVYTLEDCMNLAETHNTDLLIAKEKVNAAKNLKRAALTYYMPNVSANGGYMWNSKSISLLNDGQKQTLNNLGTGVKNSAIETLMKMGVISSPADLAALGPEFLQAVTRAESSANSIGGGIVDALNFDTRNILVGNVSLVQPIFMGGKIIQANKIAKYGVELAENDLEAKRGDNKYKTEEAYWRVVSLSNKLKLAKGYVELLKKMDSDVEKSVAIGAATKSDGLTVKVKLNEAEMSLSKVENGLVLSKMALCLQCGLPLNQEFALADENIEPKKSLETAPELDMNYAVEHRHEIKSLQLLANIAEANRRVQIGRFLPHIGVTAGYTVSNPSVLNGFKAEFDGLWQVGVAVHIPILHFGEKIFTLRTAESAKKIAEMQLNDARDKVELDITQSLHKVNEARKCETMTLTNRDKAEENLRLATRSFEEGVVAPSLLLEAQTAWLKANSDAIDAIIETKMCEVYLQKALGLLK